MSSCERSARLLDVAEAERGEPFLAAAIEQRADAGERVEQRREEELLVDRAHDRLVPLVLGVELRRARSRRRRSRKPSTRARCVRVPSSAGKRVRLVLVDELEPVLDGAQPDVGVVEASARRRCVT